MGPSSCIHAAQALFSEQKVLLDPTLSICSEQNLKGMLTSEGVLTALLSRAPAD